MNSKAIEWSSPLTLTKKVINAPSNEIPEIGTVLGELGPAEYTVATWDIANQRTVLSLKLKTFTKLVEEENLTPAKAAEEVGMDLRTIQKTAEKFGAEVQELLNSHGWMTPDVKKAWVRASQTKILDMALEGVAADPTDSKLLKVALEASRAIADDNQVGIYVTKNIPAPPNQMLSLPPGLAALVSAVEVDPAHEQEKE